MLVEYYKDVSDKRYNFPERASCRRQKHINKTKKT